jgi:hypothetical protein
MKEEKTQDISTETTTKDRDSTNKKTNETELLDLRAGYCQHTSPQNNKRPAVNNISSLYPT